MKRILGIDPGFGKMGFGCVDVDRGACKVMDFGIITTGAKEDFPNRLRALAEDLRALMKTWKPSIVAVETLYFKQNVTTGIQVAEARGIILLVAAEHGVSVIEVAPNQVKKALTGNGHAEKRAMQEMVKILLGLRQIPKPDDAADALAIAMTAATMR